MKKKILIKNEIIVYCLLLFLLLIIYLLQAFTYAQKLPSKVDEGSFLTKGYFYLTSKYKPFEDYGPWTNNMPLAYAIPGIPQAIFGPGLKVGRYFSIFISFLTFLGVWLLTRRLFGKWWSLIGIATMVLNPTWIVINVQAITQSLVACQVAWLLYFLLGKDRNNIHLSLASLLSVSVTLTRQNMVFMMPFVLLYVWWQYGFKKARIVFPIMAIPFLLVHVAYYPKIMELWYKWFPFFIRKRLNIGLIPGGGIQVWAPEPTIIDRLTSFFSTIKIYYFILFSALFSIPLFLKRKTWPKEKDWKMMVSLEILFLVLFIMHSMASLGKTYCIFCLPNYIAFFSPIILIISLYFSKMVFQNRVDINISYLLIFLIITIPGIFFASMESTVRPILNIEIPRFRSGRVLQGSVSLWELFRNKFNLTIDQQLIIISPIVGLVAVALIVILVKFLSKRIKAIEIGFPNILLLSVLLFALLLSPTSLFARESIDNSCNGNVLDSYEAAGGQLNDILPSGKNIYWGSGSEVTPLLYIADKNIEPLQLNGIYPKRRGGDREELEKNGYYNEESVRDWREKASFILVLKSDMGEFWREYLNPALFDEIGSTDPIDPCDPDSIIKIFRRK